MKANEPIYANLWTWDYNTPVFGGWVVEDMEPWRIKDGSTPYMRNGRLLWMRTVIRNWYEIHPTTWATKRDADGFIDPSWDYYGVWGKFQLLHFSTWSSPADDSVIGLYSDVWALSPTDRYLNLIDINIATGTFTRLWTSYPYYGRYNSVEMWNVIYFFNPNHAPMSYDPSVWLDITTITNQSNINSDMRPWFWIVFDGRLWVAWDNQTPEYLYRSAKLNPMDFSYPAPTTTPSFLEDSPGWVNQFNERITWLTATAQAMFVFTPWTVSVSFQWSEQNVWSSVVYPFSYIEAREWCVNNACIVPVNNQVYYLSQNNKIMIIERQRYGVYTAQWLSHRLWKSVENTLDTLDRDQSNAFWYYSPDRQSIIWHVATEWSSTNNLCIIYNIDKDEFYFDDGKPFFTACSWKWVDYTGSQLKPLVFIDNKWTNDNGSAILFKRLSKRFSLWDPTINKEFWQTRTYARIKANTELKQDIYIDWELVASKTVNGNELSTTIVSPNIPNTLREWVIVEDKDNLFKRWRFLEAYWTCSSLNWEISLENFDIRYKPLDQLTTDYN